MTDDAFPLLLGLLAVILIVAISAVFWLLRTPGSGRDDTERLPLFTSQTAPDAAPPPPPAMGTTSGLSTRPGMTPLSTRPNPLRAADAPRIIEVPAPYPTPVPQPVAVEPAPTAAPDPAPVEARVVTPPASTPVYAAPAPLVQTPAGPPFVGPSAAPPPLPPRTPMPATPPYGAPSVPRPVAPAPAVAANGSNGVRDAAPLSTPASGAPVQPRAGRMVEAHALRFSVPVDGTLQFLPGRFEITSGLDTGREIRFVKLPGQEESTITFGRTEGPAYQHIQLRDQTVSRSHASMFFSNDSWLLTNFSTTNPVSVNGRLLGEQEATLIYEGDRIEMGEVVFVYRSR
jgi:hypothetical protein